ncbi:hypothetical protein ACLOJK_016203, partial [Asimina triloba]
MDGPAAAHVPFMYDCVIETAQYVDRKDTETQPSLSESEDPLQSDSAFLPQLAKSTRKPPRAIQEDRSSQS